MLFIKRNHQIGFTLTEVRQLLDLHAALEDMPRPLRRNDFHRSTIPVRSFFDSLVSRGRLCASVVASVTRDTRTAVHMTSVSMPAGHPLSAARIRSHNGRPGLLLNSLQRAYFPDRSAGANLQRKGPGLLPAPAAPTNGSTANLIDSVLAVNELDPLPFVNRRDALPTRCTRRMKSDSHEPALGKDEGEVLVCPHRGNGRLSPERLGRLLSTGLSTEGLRGRLIDVSMSGVAIHLAEALPGETRIGIRISSRTPGKSVDAAATVLRSRQEGTTGWSVVCRFDKNLTFEQIHLVGQDLFASTIV